MNKLLKNASISISIDVVDGGYIIQYPDVKTFLAEATSEKSDVSCGSESCCSNAVAGIMWKREVVTSQRKALQRVKDILTAVAEPEVKE